MQGVDSSAVVFCTSQGDCWHLCTCKTICTCSKTGHHTTLGLYLRQPCLSCRWAKARQGYIPEREGQRPWPQPSAGLAGLLSSAASWFPQQRLRPSRPGDCPACVLLPPAYGFWVEQCMISADYQVKQDVCVLSCQMLGLPGLFTNAAPLTPSGLPWVRAAISCACTQVKQPAED